jgi:hypothetical protein
VIARFYELQTNKPLFITKGTQINARGLGSLRPDGYKISYTAESVITHYGVLVSGKEISEIEAEYKAIRHEPRPDDLYELSPWQAKPDVSVPPDKLAAMIQSLDSRGAWVEEGIIGKADRVVSVFAARPMVLTISGRPIEIRENDTIELFDGERPPRQRVMRTSTFARNLRALAAYVRSSRP